MEEKKEGREAGRKPYAWDAYLYTAFRKAEWLPEEYKTAADRFRELPAVLNELYLCACDGLPFEKAAEALEKKPAEAALKMVRRKYIADAAAGGYEQELEDVKARARQMEEQVGRITRDIDRIAEGMYGMDAMFPAPEESGKPEGSPHISSREEPPDAGQKRRMPAADAGAGLLPEQKEEPVRMQPDAGMPKTGMAAFFKKLCRSREQKLSKYVETLAAQGYDGEQMDFLLDCMEEGMDMDEIRQFASPSLPVHVMRRLKELTRRKEKLHG